MKDLLMKHKTAAEDSAYGWENESLPIGNGYIGANIFGIVGRERVQLTHNALVNPQYDDEGRMFGGLNNLAEVYIHFPHHTSEEYERGLNLTNSTAYCRYVSDGVKYEREYFASYPEQVVVIKLSASKNNALSFDVRPEIPFIKDYALNQGDGGGKSGTVSVKDNTIFLCGTLEFYNVRFECQVKVMSDGDISECKDSISVKNASDAYVIIAAQTNYELCENAFSNNNPKEKIPNINPHDKVTEIMKNALGFSYDELKSRHINDYSELFCRVDFSLCDEEPDYICDMMQKYKNGESVPCLEEVYFQFGRYLLISSSRKGGLPANLQGIWNCHDFSPWGSGYWHNINVQMNYWPAFNTNLLETFEPYIDFYNAYKPKAEEFASEYIKEHNIENYTEEKGECGWTIGTAAYPYFITAPTGHSGPGTGALTSKLFMEAYEFSQDKKILEAVTYPALLGMSKFLTKTVKNYDGEYLVSYSASPEQMNNGVYIDKGTYYKTVGCAFDQQLIYENGKDLVKSAELLGIEDDKALITQKEQLNFYSPVQIGWSGQIKEYWEEKFYGEIGEYHHRHISHLMALYPGTLINRTTPAWLDAAKLTLKNRGNNTTGWALAHRLNAWARTGDGESSYEVLRKLLSEKTMINLWDLHPPFQIDGNFGATSGVAEMLLQSHEGYIEILPALPKSWANGSFKGLLARGGFEVSVSWRNGCAEKITLKSKYNNTVYVKYKNISKSKGSEFGVIDKDTVLLNTHADGEYNFYNIPKHDEISEPENFSIDNDLTLEWNSKMPVNVYRALNSDSVYELIGKNVQNQKFKDNIDFSQYETITYKIKNVCKDDESEGVYQTINHASQKEKERYANLINELNGNH